VFSAARTRTIASDAQFCTLSGVESRHARHLDRHGVQSTAAAIVAIRAILRE
jgi:hypothetical protein